MLSRIMPYTLRGFWYYQGENDDNRPDSYAQLLTVLINRWRKDWGDETMPFLIVQLPMFSYEGKNPVRTGQNCEKHKCRYSGHSATQA